MGSIGPMEIILLGLLALLLFGPNKLPEIGRQLGKGMRDFKQSLEGTGIKEALDSVNDVRTAVNPVNAARSFLATDEAGVDEAPVVSAVVAPVAEPAALDGPGMASPEGSALPAQPVETHPVETHT